jgi:hypothetical protein
MRQNSPCTTASGVPVAETEEPRFLKSQTKGDPSPADRATAVGWARPTVFCMRATRDERRPPRFRTGHGSRVTRPPVAAASRFTRPPAGASSNAGGELISGALPLKPRHFALYASSMRKEGKAWTRQPCDGRRPHGAPGLLWNDRPCGKPPRLPCCRPNASNAGGLGAAPPNQSKYGTSEWKVSPSPNPCRLPHHSVKNLFYSERLTGHQSRTTATIRPGVRSPALRRRIPSCLPLSKNAPQGKAVEETPPSGFPLTLNSMPDPVLPRL